ncbi:PP2C family protein-serine/threonine phosphatase [Mycoplasma phocimorsus]|uniref:PP2C family protein-serine/threonine phosphatase n=1 Tax=Mycoplasma phocimorsus TaxID=3045839 RepID=UPI0024C045E1|nr:protein phosphatase 2C domain-containing protein [Mycoplasma phocimorsus]MDJ1647456.1 protein phosphatase 2C domain-containing protein [Mycoplasma phocimorsus]
MYKFATDIGIKRKENQDKGGYWDNGFYSLFILCDGMGGHFGGSIASSIVVEQFGKLFKSSLPKTFHKPSFLQKWMVNSIDQIQYFMEQQAIKKQILVDMGTTLVAAIINKKDNSMLILNIGDSRAYLLGRTLKQITIDQNVTNYFIQNNRLSYKKAFLLSNATKLISALGPNKKAKMDIFIIEPNSEYKLLILTTDGIHNYVDNPTFELILNNENFNIEQKADNLIETAKRNGSKDNLSIFIKEFK